jgi:hypothetical protein
MAEIRRFQRPFHSSGEIGAYVDKAINGAGANITKTFAG